MSRKIRCWKTCIETAVFPGKVLLYVLILSLGLFAAGCQSADAGTKAQDPPADEAAPVTEETSAAEQQPSETEAGDAAAADSSKAADDTGEVEPYQFAEAENFKDWEDYNPELRQQQDKLFAIPEEDLSAMSTEQIALTILRTDYLNAAIGQSGAVGSLQNTLQWKFPVFQELFSREDALTASVGVFLAEELTEESVQRLINDSKLIAAMIYRNEDLSEDEQKAVDLFSDRCEEVIKTGTEVIPGYPLKQTGLEVRLDAFVPGYEVVPDTDFTREVEEANQQEQSPYSSMSPGGGFRHFPDWNAFVSFLGTEPWNPLEYADVLEKKNFSGTDIADLDGSLSHAKIEWASETGGLRLFTATAGYAFSNVRVTWRMNADLKDRYETGALVLNNTVEAELSDCTLPDGTKCPMLIVRGESFVSREIYILRDHAVFTVSMVGANDVELDEAMEVIAPLLVQN